MGFGMKLVYALVAMSLGIIVFGLYLIMSEPQTNEPTAPREIGLLPVPTPATESDVPQLDSEPGTEPWCDMMMQKPGDAWEEEETRIFADQCRSEEHTSELQSRGHLVCRRLLEKKKSSGDKPALAF